MNSYQTVHFENIYVDVKQPSKPISAHFFMIDISSQTTTFQREKKRVVQFDEIFSCLERFVVLNYKNQNLRKSLYKSIKK